jgi:glycosyltransferase 2 family protein
MPSATRIQTPAWERVAKPDNNELGERHVSVLLVLGIVLSAAALFAISWDAGWNQLWLVLNKANWLWIITVPVGVFVSHVGYTFAYREVTRIGEGPDLETEEAVAMVTTGFGPVSPRGGFALDAAELSKLGMKRHEAAVRVQILAMLEYAVLAPVTFGAALYMIFDGVRAQAGLLPSWIIGFPVGTAVAIGLLIWFRRSGRPRSWWGPLRHGLQAIGEILKLLRTWPAGPVASAGMATYWTADIFALAGSMAIFAHRRGGIAALIVGYATGYALTRRSLPLAGSGVVEGLLPFALTWVGFPLAAAILAVIVYRFFNLWVAIIPALGGLQRLRRRRNRIPPRMENAGVGDSDRAPTAAGRPPR